MSVVMSFLEVWLALLASTLSAVVYNSLTSLRLESSLLAILVLEFCSLILWGTYWMVLYPNYFTPFRHLPTPRKRSWLLGNRQEFLPDHPGDDVRAAIETLPNDGLIRFYDSLSREVLLVTNPQAVRDMLSMKPYIFGHPSLIKVMMQRLTGSNFSFLAPREHKLFRKHLRSAFTGTHTKRLIPMLWEKAAEMVQMIEAELRDSPEAAIDFRSYGRRTTLDSFGLTIMGRDFQTLQQPDNEVLRRFNNMTPTSKALDWIGVLMYYIDLRPLVKLLSPLLKRSQVKQSSNYIRRVAHQIVADKQASESRDLDVISIAASSGAFPTTELVDHAMLFLTAGPNSTGAAFEWALYELGRRPDMQQRLRAKIQQCIGSAAGSPEAADLGSRVQALPYLNAICNEVIRWYPFVPLSPKVAEQDTTILDEHIPKGTMVLIAVEAFNSSKELWGPDSDRFDPDRWLENGAVGSGGASSNYAMLSFGAGPMACIGQNFAKAKLACLIAAVLGRFEIELVDSETAGKILPGQFKRPAQGIRAKVKVVEKSPQIP